MTFPGLDKHYCIIYGNLNEVKVSQTMKANIYTTIALGRDRKASPLLGCLYPHRKPSVLILQKAEWTPGPIWTRRSEGSNPGCPARSQAIWMRGKIKTIQQSHNVCLSVLMPTHCTITHFGFRTKRKDGIKCGLFLNHAPLEQTTLSVGRVSV